MPKAAVYMELHALFEVFFAIVILGFFSL